MHPTFDVHLRKINRLKISAFATTEKAKRSLSQFFKNNDIVYSFNRDRLRAVVQHCNKNKLRIYFDDNLRYRDERPED